MAFITQAEELSTKKLDSDYKNSLCSFYVEALSGILINLIKVGKLDNRDKVIKYLSNTVKDTLMGILKQQKI